MHVITHRTPQERFLLLAWDLPALYHVDKKNRGALQLYRRGAPSVKRAHGNHRNGVGAR